MSGPVDVLAVMSCAAETLVRMKGAEANARLVNVQRDALTEARAAVAELIASDKAFDVERKGFNPLYADRERLDRYEAAEKRRAAALARVQGVSA